MKNFLILGLLALLLFSISAALSLWLNQSKQTTTEKEKDKEKDKEKAGSGGSKHGEVKDTSDPHPPPKADHPAPSGGSESTATMLREREAKLERRAAQIDLVVRDIQSQREATEAKLQKVLNELKNVSKETTKLDALAADLKKQKVEFDAAEKQNIEKMSKMYDAMTPEAAAPILKEMAERGRLDMAAKILVFMKERNAARVLEAMNDPALAIQVLDKMRGIRAASTPALAPPPGGTPGVLPTGGP